MAVVGLGDGVHSEQVESPERRNAMAFEELKAKKSVVWGSGLHFLDLETCTRCSDRTLERFSAGSAGSPTVADSDEAPCCSPAELQTCCDSEDKAECCGAATGGGCGCR